MPKSIDIINEFHIRESDFFLIFSSNLKENCESHGLNILNKKSNSHCDFAHELADLVLNNCDINYYISSYKKKGFK